MNSLLLRWIIITGVSLAVLIDFTFSLSITKFLSCNSLGGLNCTEGFKNDSYIPSLILTLTITAAGFWALIFRSDQTTKQIAVAIDHNTFNNFISHKKTFIELLEDLEKDKDYKIEGKSGLYKKLFPINSPAYITFECDEGALFQMTVDYKKHIEKVKQSFNREGNIIPMPIGFMAAIMELHKSLGVSTNESAFKPPTNDKEVKNVHKKLIAALDIPYETLLALANFSTDNDSTKLALRVQHPTQGAESQRIRRHLKLYLREQMKETLALIQRKKQAEILANL